MKLADLVGKSWLIKEERGKTTILINVTGVDVFKSSYDGVAGEIRAEAIYKTKTSEWVGDSIEKVNNDYPINIDVVSKTCFVEEVPYQTALAFVRSTARGMFPELF